MANRRTAKVAAALRQVVSTAILFELRDPRVKNVTILSVEAAEDLRTAKIYVSIMGDAKTARLSLKGLNSARGFIQSRIADELQLRLTPVLTFVVDEGVKKSIEVSRVLRDLQPAEGESDPVDVDGDDEDDEDNSGEEEE
ncbi:30S ribosome-binding factor RbfA [Planctomicrobium sp. SH664]|uniref:30S ribosome-binding factor RbfA n=1 Tax=Planctomicrobium sp. SH664 TaxID=3448125 RepID=UPI003F5B11BA